MGCFTWAGGWAHICRYMSQSLLLAQQRREGGNKRGKMLRWGEGVSVRFGTFCNVPFGLLPVLFTQVADVSFDQNGESIEHEIVWVYHIAVSPPTPFLGADQRVNHEKLRRVEGVQ